ncbi:hypothetical protein GSI_02980 [Ganoderma sinense ZZ0214-1]|uniref:Uncharacterized protein n=1 Tax=Ganoderma sinense ZZ0214-1 TaxID=1077348 RepID=A0A2G8SN58_9APHY|nr:hypothetical protein GSI_02980 [Ganoderma sinense ZZ0214-1]
MSASCTRKYRPTPTSKVNRPSAIITAPSGRANRCMSSFIVSAERVNSCTSAGRTRFSPHRRDRTWEGGVRRESDAPTPVEAMVRLVRVYARKVRSDARWSRATLPEFSRVSMSRHRFDSSRHHDSLASSFFITGPPTSRAVAASSMSCCSSDQSGVELPLPLRDRRFRPRRDISSAAFSWWCRSLGWAREGAGEGGRGGEAEVGRLVRTVGHSRAAIFGGFG